MAAADAKFSIVYDGEAVADGVIDARELAPALLALADVFDEAKAVTPEADAQITLRIRAGFQQGSFEVYLELFLERFVNLFSGTGASALANLFDIVGITGVAGVLGLLQLIKVARGRKPASVTIERSERVKITFEGGESVAVDNRVWALFNKLRVRKAIEQVIAPLLRQGIDTFKIRHKGKDQLIVKEDEARYFEAPTEHAGETISTVETRVTIVAPSFQEGNKWRVSDGSRVIFVAVEDTAFVGAVQKGTEAFRKGDILRVTLETRQWLEGTELKAQHAIVKVLDHEVGATQQGLFPSREDSGRDNGNAGGKA